MKIQKRIIAFILICAFMIMHINTFYAMAGTESLLNDNLTLQVKSKQLNNGSTTILGKSFTMDELGDLSDGIMLMMYLQNVAAYDDFSYSNTKYDRDEYIYSKNNVGFYCNDVSAGDIIIAENDINIYLSMMRWEILSNTMMVQRLHGMQESYLAQIRMVRTLHMPTIMME